MWWRRAGDRHRRRALNNVDPYTYLSCFAGAGGLDLGLRICLPEARCIGYVECEAQACVTLGARIAEGSLDDAPIWSDVRTFPSKLYRGRVAGIVAGFPCPDYSVAGKREGIEGEHGQLWWDLLKVIEGVCPEWVFLENVPGLPTATGQRFRCVCGWSDRWRGFLHSTSRSSAKSYVSSDSSDLGIEGDWCLERSLLEVRRFRSTAGSTEAEGSGDRKVANVGKESTMPHRTAVAIYDDQTAAGRDLSRHSDETMAQVSREPQSNRRKNLPVLGCEEESRGIEPARADYARKGLYCPACGQLLDDEESGSLRGALGDVLWSLSGLGFSSEWCHVRAADVGAAHGRKRWFCLAYRKGYERRWQFESGEPQRNGRPGSSGICRALAISAEPGFPRRGDPARDGGEAPGIETAERAGAGLVDAALGECGELREPSAQRGRFSGGTGEALEDAPRDGQHGCERENGRGGRRRVCETGDALGDAIVNGDSAGISAAARRDGEPAESAEPDYGSEDPGLFAPGPSDARWPDLLVRYPWLRPAIAQAEAESAFRDLADGMAALVDGDRTSALRALGNGCVALQAAVAFKLLARRIRAE